MRKVDIKTAEEAAAMVFDGAVICTAALNLTGHAESVLKALESSFLKTGSPCNLTFMNPAGGGDSYGRGSSHFAHEGMTKRYIGAHWGNVAEWVRLVAENKVECFNFSQGTLVQMYRAAANGQPGHLTKTGLHTFLDPRQDGGKQTQRAKDSGDDLVELINLNGEEYLLYKPVAPDFVMCRGTYADEYGNVSMEDEAIRLETMFAVLTAKRYGGKVIVQVKRVVKAGSLNPMNVVIPGHFVDVLVECQDLEEDHRMTVMNYYEPAYMGKFKLSEDKLPGMPVAMNIRKIIGRRAAMEARKGSICNVGVGIPYDVISRILYEEGISKDVYFTVETGVYGGLLPDTRDFGAAYNADAIIDQATQFDFYNGIGVDIAFMGCGEIDSHGNCNASNMGDKVTGCGGFPDITQYAKRVVFCMPFTARGLKIAIEEDGIRILQEGQTKKFVNHLRQLTYNANYARQQGHEAMIVTERAVFLITEGGLVLTEIAKGIDLQKDILDQMEFIPQISENLKEIDARIYQNGLVDYKSILGCAE